KGMTFVITGETHHFKNRKELQDYIESQGGRVAGSVSGSTSFLINNDIESTSGKNKKAKELGIPILSEYDFLSRFTDSQVDDSQADVSPQTSSATQLSLDF
ncbi:MAG: BRCT domain-containing protein, partial [Prevotella sp.]|nr:BRCT domain-containing protein [Prevotella sp.]